MSNTHKTNKARLAREMSRDYLDSQNAGKHDDTAQRRAEIRELGVDGKRYGNKRRYEAESKVIARRIERKKTNRNIDEDYE